MAPGKKPQFSCVSEVEKPEIILLHEPGLETKLAVENVDDWGWDTALKEDPRGFEEWLVDAQKEYQGMVSVLQSEGIEVLYLTHLLEAKPAECKRYLQMEYKKVESKVQELSRLLQNAIKEAYEQMLDSPIDGILLGLEIGKKFSKFPYKQRFEVYKQLKTLMPQTSLLFPQDPVISMPNGLVKARMSMWIRYQEPDIVELALGEENYIHKLRNRTEGGDVTMASLNSKGNYINSVMLVGISALSGLGIDKELEGLKGKASLNSAVKLYVPDYFNPVIAYAGGNVMHLDTLIMPLAEDVLLVKKDMLKQTAVRAGEKPIANAYDWAKQNFNTVDIDSSEKGDCGLATNVLPLGNGKVLSSISNPRTNENMIKAGIKVLEIETKALNLGYGSLHCLTAYLK